MSRVAEYQKSAKEKLDAVTALFLKIDTDQAGQETPEQHEQVKTWNKEAEEFLQSAQKAEGWDAQREAAKKGQEYLSGVERGFQYAGANGHSDRQQGAVKTYGEKFIENEDFSKWLKSITPTGDIHPQMRVHSPAVPVEASLKSLITGGSATSAGAVVNTEHLGILDRGTFMRPLRVVDLISMGETTSDSVDYVRITGFTNAAAPVAEATATGGSSGVKPQSAMTTELVTANVKTVATWMEISRQAVSDAPQMRSLVDDLLKYALAEEMDDQIIAGSGTGNNFTGVLNTSGTQSQAFSADLLTTARKARTLVSLIGRATPSAYVFHPNDWEDFDLLTDNEERYYFGGPVGVGTPRLWGVPIVESEAMTEGTGVVADWRWARVWDRMRTAILVSDSHSDNFIRNILTLLAELRAAMGIIRPSAFVEIALA